MANNIAISDLRTYVKDVLAELGKPEPKNFSRLRHAGLKRTLVEAGASETQVAELDRLNSLLQQAPPASEPIAAAPVAPVTESPPRRRRTERFSHESVIEPTPTPPAPNPSDSTVETPKKEKKRWWKRPKPILLGLAVSIFLISWIGQQTWQDQIGIIAQVMITAAVVIAGLCISSKKNTRTSDFSKIATVPLLAILWLAGIQLIHSADGDPQGGGWLHFIMEPNWLEVIIGVLIAVIGSILTIKLAKNGLAKGVKVAILITLIAFGSWFTYDVTFGGFAERSRQHVVQQGLADGTLKPIETSP